MADKGFLIQDELAASQAHLVIPPLLKKKLQFSEEELDSTTVACRTGGLAGPARHMSARAKREARNIRL